MIPPSSRSDEVNVVDASESRLKACTLIDLQRPAGITHARTLRCLEETGNANKKNESVIRNDSGETSESRNMSRSCRTTW